MAKTLTDFERMQIEDDIKILMAERRRRLNEVMQDKHITLVELEKLTGVAKSSIQRYLTGETTKIPIDFFEKFAMVTNTPLDYVTCYDKQKNTSIGEYRGEFEDLLASLNEQQREQVKQYARFISGSK
ncbi:helix-turn-helix transcriptional regulator [Ruminococcus sp.]|uniref:helix-turn-helix domain-containing protein n=1 Tax=Ruminococcus sp. TaxID=41978 RepID=UPI001B407684|nr:helix-turn-helix transcriptional regulator [Ruminococcus sp.]MBP5432127.1 helix-turn-helix transcriptional regulator [Ruminococcus sp.]